MSTRQDFVIKIGYYVGGTLPLGNSEKEQAIALAVDFHSRISPRLISVDVTGTGAFEYKCSTYLTSWVENFSIIKSVEYPVDDTDETPDMMLDEQLIKDYKKSNETYFRFLDDVPPTTESFRVNYTTRHTVSDATSTIPAQEENSFVLMSSALFCKMIAGYYAQQGDSSIGADAARNDDLTSRYLKMYSSYKKDYNDLMGIDKNNLIQAASITMDQDADASWQTDKLTHPRRYR